MLPAQTYAFPLIEKQQVSRDAYAFYFKKDPQFTFLAGQYIRITLPIENPDERGNTRLFSLITSPQNKERIGITTRIIQSSFKHALLALLPGTAVQIFGPMGKFILEESQQQPQVFLAGGIGITPFFSMLQFAADKKLTIPITFFVSFSTVADMIFYKELKTIANENLLIKVIYTITQPEDSSWNGETGRISKELITKYVSDVSLPMYSVAGPQVMVDSMVSLVKDMGVLPEKIRRENFVGY